MPYITTEYDYELQAEVYKISGDRGYAHTTDTSLVEVTDESSRVKTHITYFAADFTVDVTRDIAESKVVFYDNGEAIPFILDSTEYEMLDWSINNSATTVTLHLGYGIEHNIYARYLGSKKALPSKSPILTIFEEMPALFTSTIERTDSVVQYDKNTTINLPISFTSGKTHDLQQIKEIKVYSDDVLVGSGDLTLDVGETVATGTLQIIGGLDSGLHTINLVFEGDEYNEETSTSFNISVGYQVLVEHTPIMVLSDNTDFNNLATNLKTTVTDYFNAPVENVATFINVNGSNVHSMGNTDEDGIYTYHNVSNMTYPTFKVSATVNSKNYLSEDVKLPIIRLMGGLWDIENQITAEDNIIDIGASVRGWYWEQNEVFDTSGIPHLFRDKTTNELFVEYSNEYGNCYHKFTGSNSGTHYMEVICGDKTSNEFYIEDLTQYWQSDGMTLNKLYRVLAGNFTEQKSGYKLQAIAANQMAVLGIDDGDDSEENWTIVFRVVSASTVLTKLAFGSWSTSGGANEINSIGALTNITLKAKTKVKVKYSKVTKLITVYINDVEKATFPTTNSKGCPFIAIQGAGKVYLNFNKLKYRRVY